MVPFSETENTVRGTGLGRDHHKFYFGHIKTEEFLRQPQYIIRTKMLKVMDRCRMMKCSLIVIW